MTVGAVEWLVGIDLHERVLVHEHLLGERTEVDELRDRCAADVRPWRCAGGPVRPGHCCTASDGRRGRTRTFRRTASGM